MKCGLEGSMLFFLVYLLQSLVAYFFVFDSFAVKVYLFLQMLEQLQKNEDILMFSFGW